MLLATGLYMGFNTDSTLFTGYLAVEDRTIDGEEKSIRTYLDSITNADTYGEVRDEIANIYNLEGDNVEGIKFPIAYTDSNTDNNNNNLIPTHESVTEFIEENERSIARGFTTNETTKLKAKINNIIEVIPTTGLNNAPFGAKGFIMPITSGGFANYFGTEYNDQNIKCSNPARGIISLREVKESLLNLIDNRYSETENEVANEYLSRLKELTASRQNPNYPFSTSDFDLDKEKDENQISYYTYEDLQKLFFITGQISTTIKENNPQEGCPLFEINYFQDMSKLDQSQSYFKYISNDPTPQAIDFILNQNTSTKPEYTFIKFQDETIPGVDITNLNRESDITDELANPDSRSLKVVNLNTDYNSDTNVELYFTTDQNKISYSTFILQLDNEDDVELDETLKTSLQEKHQVETNDIQAIEAGVMLVKQINQPQTPGLQTQTISWDKTCLGQAGSQRCDTSKKLNIIVQIKSEVEELDSNFERDDQNREIEETRYSYLQLSIEHGAVDTDELANLLEFGNLVFNPDQGTTGEAMQIIYQGLPDTTQLPEDRTTIQFELREDQGSEAASTLTCQNSENSRRLDCAGTAPLTAGEYQVYLKIGDSSAVRIGRGFETYTVTGEDRTGDTGAGDGDGGTQAGETEGNAVTASPIQEGEVTSGSNMTLEVPLTDAQSTDLGIEVNSTVQVRLVDSNDNNQSTLTCSQTDSGLNCEGQAPEQGEYTVVVVVVNNDGTITTHNLQETENGQTSDQSVEIQAAELEIDEQNSQEVELHNAEITLRGSQLDNLEEVNLSLVPTNDTLTRSDNNAETLNPTNITANNQGTEATLFFGDVFPGNYQLIHNDTDTIINNVVVINPSIASPSRDDSEVALKPEIAFGSLYTLTNSYRIEISTANQNIYTKSITANSQTDVITHVVESDLNPGSIYTLKVLPLFNASPVANVYNTTQFTTTSQAPVTNEQLRNVVLTCNNNDDLYTDSTANCSFNLPPNATLAAGAKMRFQGSADSAVVQITGSQVVAAIPTPATAGNYYIEVLSADESNSTVINQQFTITVFGDQPVDTTDPNDPVDPANPDEPQEPGDTPVVQAEDLINVSRDKRIDAGESMDLKVKLAKDSDFNLAVVTLYKIEELDEDADEDEEADVEQVATLYYHCSESIEDDIDCPEYEEENLSGKKTLRINYDTSNLEAGNYIIQVFTQDNDSNTYVVEKDLKVRSNQVVPGLPTPPGQVSQCNQFFADMAPNDPQCYDVIFLRQYGLFNGQNINGMTVAQLQQTISRAEMFAILGKLYGFSQNYVNLQELAAYYTDISEQDAANQINQWWMVPLYHLTANQIITGYGDGTIKAAQAPTMAEFAKSIGQAVGFTTYLDTNKNPWYTDLVNMYYGYGVRFQPEMATNRRGAVHLLSRTMQIIQNPSLNASHNPYQSNGLGYSAGYQAVPGGYNNAGYASNGYGVGNFNNQSQTSYNQYGYQGMNAAGSNGNMQQLGYGAYGYEPYSQYQMTGF